MSDDWPDFNVWLFDFDGLLADTERTHYAAYKSAAAAHNVNIEWTFAEYCVNAHFNESGLHSAIFSAYPALAPLTWPVFYAEKKAAFVALVEQQQDVRLLSGASELLTHLSAASVPRCVATNSTLELIESVRAIHGNAPLLSIETWFTRGTYKNAKPSPECYIESLKALIEAHALKGKLNVIGLEDTPRGLKALVDARSHFLQQHEPNEINLIPVFVTAVEYDGLDEYIADADAFVRIESLTELKDNKELQAMKQ